MTDLDKAVTTQLANIEKRTGKSLPELAAIVKGSGLSKHGELVAMLKTTLAMGHGDANTLVHVVLKSDGQSAAEGLSDDQVLDGFYTGPKAMLRPIHVEVGINAKGLKASDRLLELPAGQMCNYKVKLTWALL